MNGSVGNIGSTIGNGNGGPGCGELRLGEQRHPLEPATLNWETLLNSELSGPAVNIKAEEATRIDIVWNVNAGFTGNGWRVR